MHAPVGAAGEQLELTVVFLSLLSGLATNLLSAEKTTNHIVSRETLIENAAATLSATSHLRQ